MKILTTLCLLLLCISIYSQDCTSPGDAQIDLNVNNINARLLNSGDMWWDGAEGLYITPSDGSQDVSAIFAGALWIGGISPLGNLKLAAQTYRGPNETDFYPGPLQDQTGEAFLGGCENWDMFWVVNKIDVQEHLADYADGNIDNKLNRIYNWPGRNNPYFESAFPFPIPPDQKLAPFYDNDQDGNYNPDNGDYPLIKGDQSIWWVFNDNAGAHNVTQTQPMQIEVHAMAYAFTDDKNDHLNNATFYDFEIINKASEPLLNTYLGLWADFDLGCHEDDYVGYSQDDDMMYVYNSDDIDGDANGSCIGAVTTYGNKIPMMGIKKLDSNINPVTSFSMINNVFQGSAPSTNDPVTGNEYYNYLKGLWRDGTALTVGGNGFDPGSTDTTSFLFTGDPSDDDEWSMCSASLPLGDRRAMMSSSISDLLPGQSVSSSYAVIFVEDVMHPCPSLDKLKEAADAVCEAVISSTEEPDHSFAFSISPNPATDVLIISSAQKINSINVLAMNGQVMMRQKVYNNLTTTLDISRLAAGLYLVSIEDERGNVAVDKVVKN